MKNHSLFKSGLAEFFGTALLLIAIVGSGIMGTRLFEENTGTVLLVNAIATGVALIGLIIIFGRTSGAHFNPAVTLSELLLKKTAPQKAMLYFLCQILGAVLGTIVANTLFSEPAFQLSSKERVSFTLFVSEVLCTSGLILIIQAAVRHGWIAIGLAVGFYIFGAVLLTPSTAFANPAVTIGRIGTETFTGIHLASVGPFLFAQFIGAILAVPLTRQLFPSSSGAFRV
jgi:glycerol uptake facilitator-like aquaporin